MRWIYLALVMLTLPGSPAAAHDYWMEHEPHELRPGDAFVLRLLVGDGLEPEVERPFQADMTTRFELHTPAGVVDLAEGRADSTFPLLESTLPDAGYALLVMDRRFHTLEGTLADFRSFLEHEGQGELAEPYAGMDPATPLHRRYARNLKALLPGLDAADGAGELVGGRVGQELEILLDPGVPGRGVGGELRGTLLFRGEPLVGQPGSAMVRRPDGELHRQPFRTGPGGHFAVALEHPGQWVLRVAHLLRTGGDAADWDTHYALFSFWLEPPGTR